MSIIERLKIDEGFKSKPYHDSEGILTIGYGRNLEDVGVSQGEAELLLVNDVAKARDSVLRKWSWAGSLDSVRLSVLIMMAFNMGMARLLEFVKTLDAVEHGDYERAAQEMLDSKWAKTQVGDRAKRLAEMMKTGKEV